MGGGQALLPNNRTCRNVLKLCQGWFRLNIRKNSSKKRVVKQWNRMPKQVVESLSLEILKRCVDVALGDIV